MLSFHVYPFISINIKLYSLNNKSNQTSTLLKGKNSAWFSPNSPKTFFNSYLQAYLYNTKYHTYAYVHHQVKKLPTASSYAHHTTFLIFLLIYSIIVYSLQHTSLNSQQYFFIFRYNHILINFLSQIQLQNQQLQV